MNQKHLITTTARRVLVCSAMLPAFLAFCPPEVAAAVNGVNAVAQADVVKGKVVDQSGEPIIGATVKVEGQDKGALTDLDGNFSISGVKSGKLVITYIGYKTATVNVTAGTPVTVTIEEDTKTLGEVVVVGFGVQKKANLTGAVSVVDSEQFEGRPVRTATEALQGAVPGLQISSTGGSLENNMRAQAALRLSLSTVLRATSTPSTRKTSRQSLSSRTLPPLLSTVRALRSVSSSLLQRRVRKER